MYSGSLFVYSLTRFLAEKPPRFIVTDVYAEGKGVTTRGRVVQGFLQVGDKVVVLPIGDIATVYRLEHVQPPSSISDSSNSDSNANTADEYDAKRLAIAMAGDTVELVLTGIDLMRVSVGNILAHPTPLTARPPVAKRARAKLLVMDQLTVPIIRGAQVLFHMHSLDVPAVLTKLVAITKRDGSVKKERPRALTGGASAIVELTLSDKIVLEPFTQCRALGRFVLRRGGETIAVGVIDELLLS
jgi:elongation factor 1 alpha-like protein